jgi:acyl-CoA dehydrogenase
VIILSAPTGDALQAAQRVAAGPAATYAAEVDRLARFPVEAVAALREDRLLGAGIPQRLGGLGLRIDAQARIVQTLAQGCASTAVIWAMHQIQVACIVRHTHGSPFFEDYLRAAAERQLLIASITSEVGVGGDIRSSIAAVEMDSTAARLSKHGATISYGEYADAYLVSARRTPDATASDQVLVLLQRSECVLEQTGGWDTLGMRGTCSPPFRVSADFSAHQILPEPFADICAQTMVPYSHILWSACWLGIATDAVRRARLYARARAARGVSAPDARLADAASLLAQMRASLNQCITSYDTLVDQDPACRPTELGLAIEMNNLKLGASELVVGIVSQALAMWGMAGYTSDGPYSVGRHLRDAYSAGCMISNERLREANVAMLLVHKGL